MLKKILENKSELLIKDTEVSILKEDIKLLVKRFREIKEVQKKRQHDFSQVISGGV